MYTKRGIMWFRQDLRLHDNEALCDAISSTDEVLPVYIFDERAFLGQTHQFGFPKTGAHRAQFIIDSVQHLRKALKAIGSNLIVRVGRPEEILFELAGKVKSNWVFCNRERTPNEVYVQDELEQRLWTIGQEIRYARGKMLYYTADLPFPITHTPDTFSQFRKEVERYVPVRAPLPAPRQMQPIMVRIEEGEIPNLDDFGLGPLPEHSDHSPGVRFEGGEAAGLQRLNQFLWGTDDVYAYADEQDGVVGQCVSSLLSPWLAQGCVSPKMVFHQLSAYAEERGAEGSVTELKHSLIYRDFLRLMVKKHGPVVFGRGGLAQEPKPHLKEDMELLRKWTAGRTGVPFIDAGMRELAATGYLSNRCRQNVAGFLVNDMGVSWQMGAEYFESVLVDYDVASNWMNWNAAAGLTFDSREDKAYNTIAQAVKYDPSGEYVKTWLPELAGVPADKIHQPDLLTPEEQQQIGLHIGADYPQSMIGTERWRAR